MLTPALAGPRTLPDRRSRLVRPDARGRVAMAVVLGVALAVDAWADVLADPGPDPRAFDPRERPTDVLPRASQR
ncbi:hypothetical protein GCM10023203_11480 [Actinomycetospora straminea]|uniref:Uncharacterized protein n=1 Tax=Actinomycetospora straminea TaxID=663607 RepID=A0ABP9E0T1_9PSEU